MPDGYEDIIKDAVYNNFYGLDTTTEINGDTILRVIMNSDVYASRFLPSILNAGISQILAVQISTDNTTWVDFLHMPITASPSLDKAHVTVNVVS